MKYTTTKLVFLLTVICGYGQSNGPIQITDQKTRDGLTIYATNEDILPYTIELSVTQTNLESDLTFPAKIVLEPTTEPRVIAVLTKKDPSKGWSYGSQFTYYKGDYRAKHEDGYIYALPFEKGRKFLMSQGYGGSFSHQGKKAIDFTMPVGTKVLCARPGLVVRVKEASNQGCPDQSCMELANLITILHEDGSLADYVHLQENGSAVEVGQQVSRGDLIGYSGATGFASGAHLHFEVYVPSREGNETVATLFQTAPGKQELLKEKVSYTAF
ncbi:MAG: M23 family metallopeptidase [Bacteroidota bacterium]